MQLICRRFGIESPCSLEYSLLATDAINASTTLPSISTLAFKALKFNSFKNSEINCVQATARLNQYAVIQHGSGING